jgi:hypothetical protein
VAAEFSPAVLNKAIVDSSFVFSDALGVSATAVAVGWEGVPKETNFGCDIS